MAKYVRVGLARELAGLIFIFIFVAGAWAYRCTRAANAPSTEAGRVESAGTAQKVAGAGAGLSAPLAAAHGADGDVVVAGLDVAAASIRVQRIDANDRIIAEKAVFRGVAWSGESELKVVSAGGSVAITWRGLRGGKLVRQLVVFAQDLTPRGEPVDVTAASCATEDAFWFMDGPRVVVRPWTGPVSQFAWPKEREASVVCGAHRAFAMFDEDDKTSLVALDGGETGALRVAATPMVREADFGDDEPRERADYTVGDDIGVVRLGVSGALSVREVTAAGLGKLRRLRTSIPRDSDVVAVDASSKSLAVIFTEEAAAECGKTASAGSSVAIRVNALRVDRVTFEESVFELAPGSCGREVGPFFTSATGENVAVSWVERFATVGEPRAKIAGLAYRALPATGPLGELSRVETSADTLVDAGCDSARCYAVALARVTGIARVLRYGARAGR